MSDIDCRELWNDIEQLREKRRLFQEQIDSADANGTEDTDSYALRKTEADAEACSDRLLKKYRKELYSLNPDLSINMERLDARGDRVIALDDGRLIIGDKLSRLTVLEPDGDSFSAKIIDTSSTEDEAIASLPGGSFLAVSTDLVSGLFRGGNNEKDIHIYRREGGAYVRKTLNQVVNIAEITKISDYHFIVKDSYDAISIIKIEDDKLVAESFDGLRNALPLPDGSIVGTAKDDGDRSVILHYKPKQEGQYEDCDMEQIGYGEVKKVLPNGDLIVSSGGRLFLHYQENGNFVRQEQPICKEQIGSVSIAGIHTLDNGDVIIDYSATGRKHESYLYRRKDNKYTREFNFSQREDILGSSAVIYGQFVSELSDGTLILKVDDQSLQTYHPIRGGGYKEGMVYGVTHAIGSQHAAKTSDDRLVLIDGAQKCPVLFSRDDSLDNLKRNIDKLIE